MYEIYLEDDISNKMTRVLYFGLGQIEILSASNNNKKLHTHYITRLAKK
jgi:hypothetical protein